MESLFATVALAWAVAFSHGVLPDALSSAGLWLDGELAGRDFVAGGEFTMADICGVSGVDFADWIGLPVPEAAPQIAIECREADHHGGPHLSPAHHAEHLQPQCLGHDGRDLVTRPRDEP